MLSERQGTGVALDMRVVRPAVDHRQRAEELRLEVGDYLAEGTDVDLAQHQYIINSFY